jgi:Protein of unknown function (DUF1186)/SEC-C motif
MGRNSGIGPPNALATLSAPLPSAGRSNKYCSSRSKADGVLGLVPNPDTGSPVVWDTKQRPSLRILSRSPVCSGYTGNATAHNQVVFLFAPIETRVQLIRERRVDAAQVIAQLAFRTPLPVEAIRSVEADRAAALPIFLRTIDSYLSPGGDPAAQEALFFIFHLLGAWHEKSAYRPLGRLLRCPTDDLDAILGDFSLETGPRVMAAVFDGDPRPLYDLIHDQNVDQFLRGAMCETVAIVTLQGNLPREEAARFLRACYSELSPQGECWVWHGWQAAIAVLGLVELKPLVEEAFARGFISSSWLGREDFEEDLQRAMHHQPPLPASGNFTRFGDVIEELSSWSCFEPETPEIAAYDEKLRRYFSAQREPTPAINPFKGVGRNDPCSCGSGKKFKKCCLRRDAEVLNAA